jgi:hypothetical protein
MPAARLTSSAPEWAGCADAGDLFCSGLWFRHFAATALSADEAPYFLESKAGDETLALALKPGRSGAFPGPTLLESMTSYYSCGYGPMARGPMSTEGCRALADALADAAAGYDGVRLGPVDRDALFPSLCFERLRAMGLQVFWSRAYRNWFGDTRDVSYAQYLKKLRSSFPATSEKRRQAFLRKGSGSIRLVSTSDRLPEAIASYQAIYGESWKVPEPFPEFVPGLIRLAAANGWLRLGLLHVGDEPAAAQLWFVVDGRALIYKVAYAERYAKHSVGSILTCAMLQHVIDIDRVREVDFLAGDDAYKAKWMLARRDRYTLLAFNRRRWRGLIAGMREALAQRRDALHGAADEPAAPVDRIALTCAPDRIPSPR